MDYPLYPSLLAEGEGKAEGRFDAYEAGKLKTVSLEKVLFKYKINANSISRNRGNRIG